MYLAQGHNALTPVRLEPVAPLSRVKHSTTALPVIPHLSTIMVLDCFIYSTPPQFRTINICRVKDSVKPDPSHSCLQKLAHNKSPQVGRELCHNLRIESV